MVGDALEGDFDCKKEQIIKFHDALNIDKALRLAWDPASNKLISI